MQYTTPVQVETPKQYWGEDGVIKHRTFWQTEVTIPDGKCVKRIVTVKADTKRELEDKLKCMK